MNAFSKKFVAGGFAALMLGGTMVGHDDPGRGRCRLDDRRRHFRRDRRRDARCGRRQGCAAAAPRWSMPRRRAAGWSAARVSTHMVMSSVIVRRGSANNRVFREARSPPYGREIRFLDLLAAA